MAPAGEIVASPALGMAPLVTALSFAPAADSGPVETFEWIFGDASPSSSEPAPVHKFEDPGPYTVTLNLTGPDVGGSRETFSTSAQVVVSARPRPVRVVGDSRSHRR